jgi:hypothetical protein
MSFYQFFHICRASDLSMRMCAVSCVHMCGKTPEKRLRETGPLKHTRTHQEIKSYLRLLSQSVVPTDFIHSNHFGYIRSQKKKKSKSKQIS